MKDYYKSYQSLLSKSWLTDTERVGIKSKMKEIRRKKKAKVKKRNFKLKREYQNKIDKQIKRKKEYKAYLQSPKWKIIRDEILERDNYRCVFCFNPENLHIHHLHYNNFKNEQLVDLITLCKSCHKGEHEKSIE